MLRWLARSFSATVAAALALGIASWPLRADLLDGAMVAGRNILPPNVQTLSYTANLSDCFRPMIQMGTGLTGPLTVTLPPSANLPNGCLIRTKNGDIYTGDNTGRGMVQSGYPSDLFAMLFPQQVSEVINSPTGWQTALNPGRWKVPQQVRLHVDKTNGNNLNDGLASGAGNAVLDAQTAWNNQQYHFDNQGVAPIIAMACAQTHTTALSMGGTPVGTNLVQLSPDGNCSFTWTNSGPCISFGDLAELDLNLTFFGGSGGATFGCNTSNAALTGNILSHNQTPVLDVEGTPVWNPAGSSDNFFFQDGPGQFTFSNGVTQATAAGGNRIIFMSAGGHGTQSGTISASAAGTLGGIFFIGGGAMFVRGTSDGAGWTSLGNSIVTSHGTLINNGVTTASGITLGTSGVNCASITTTC